MGIGPSKKDSTQLRNDATKTILSEQKTTGMISLTGSLDSMTLMNLSTTFNESGGNDFGAGLKSSSSSTMTLLRYWYLLLTFSSLEMGQMY